jgi:CRP-like cAMP-binding protein
MSASKHTIAGNRILSTLAPAEYRRLRSSLEQVELNKSQTLYAPGDVINHIYFPDDAVVSLLFAVDERRTVEVAMEGNEGAVGFAIYMGGVTSCNLSIVREAGTAQRLEVNSLKGFINQSDCLPGLLEKYVHALINQVAQSGVCNRFHYVEARVARWLLMTQDRLKSNEISATQESIAGVLGVRRSSVTAAASGLHRENIIHYARGRIEILDQRGLHAASCACYGLMKRQYDSFLD